MPIFILWYEFRGLWYYFDTRTSFSSKYTHNPNLYVYLLKSKKGNRTHPTPLGIVRRRPPQSCKILCHNENFYEIENFWFFYKYFWIFYTLVKVHAKHFRVYLYSNHSHLFIHAYTCTSTCIYTCKTTYKLLV